MPPELVLTGLGASLGKALLRLWLADQTIARDLSLSAAGIIEKRVSSVAEQRQMQRAISRLEEEVALRLEPLTLVEFRGLDGGDQAAAIDAVAKSIDRSVLDLPRLVDSDLDPLELSLQVRGELDRILIDVPLSEVAEQYALRLLEESARYICKLASDLPGFTAYTTREILARETSLLEMAQEILAQLEVLTLAGAGGINASAGEFELSYLEAVQRKLDRVELLGLPYSERRYRFPLNVAYLELAAEGPRPETPDNQGALGEALSISQALARGRRTLVRGEAGSGKTTLLQWLAVVTASRNPPEALKEWGNLVPFLIRLRRHVDKELPRPEEFVAGVAPNLLDRMPRGWVQGVLEQGRGLLLIDGVDEVPAERREAARRWLENLIEDFPDNVFILTSRPPAVRREWERLPGFKVADLQEMSPHQIDLFVKHWHEAAYKASEDEEAAANILRYQGTIRRSLRDKPYLRQLSKTPLLCALICAINFAKKNSLPRDRRELYSDALSLLLEGRERAKEGRALDEVAERLTEAQRTLLLQQVALWFLENGYSDAPAEPLKRLITERLTSLRVNVEELPPNAIFDALLLRSGILREPVPGRVDFIHKSFLEFLAAKELLRQEKAGSLVTNATNDQWREVVIFAAGEAGERSPKEMSALIRGLLDRGDKEPGNKHSLHLLAVACLETVPELESDLEDRLSLVLRDLLPPVNFTEAAAVASAGEIAIQLLVQSYKKPGGRKVKARPSMAIVRALSIIGGEKAREALEVFVGEKRVTVVRELIRAWSAFDPALYASRVLRRSPLEHGSLRVEDGHVIPGIHHLEGLDDLTIVMLGGGEFLEGLQTCRDFPTRVRVLSSERLVSLDFVKKLPGLESLHVSGCANVSDFSALSGATNLETLGLYGCDSLTQLPDMSSTAVKVVRVDGCQNLLSVHGLTSSGLQSLHISNTAVRGLPPGLSALQTLVAQGCPELETLGTVQDCSDTLRHVFVSGSAIQEWSWLRTLTNLEELRLESMPNLVELPAMDLWGGSLKRVSLGGNDLLSSAEMVGGLPALESLSLAGCKSLVGLPAPSTAVLRVLDLSDCVALNGFEDWAEIPSLRLLGMSGCSQMAPIHLRVGGDSLQFVDLRGYEGRYVVDIASPDPKDYTIVYTDRLEGATSRDRSNWRYSNDGGSEKSGALGLQNSSIFDRFPDLYFRQVSDRFDVGKSPWLFPSDLPPGLSVGWVFGASRIGQIIMNQEGGSLEVPFSDHGVFRDARAARGGLFLARGTARITGLSVGA